MLFSSENKILKVAGGGGGPVFFLCHQILKRTISWLDRCKTKPDHVIFNKNLGIIRRKKIAIFISENKNNLIFVLCEK